MDNYLLEEGVMTVSDFVEKQEPWQCICKIPNDKTSRRKA
jgi:hypothetical protein